MKVKQKYFGKSGTIIFLAMISAFPPLSTDLYLPALPQLTEYFSTTPSRVNMTLSFFFIFYATGLLFWGPLSEKYGRKPILLAGHGIYIIASILCAVSQTVDQLIFFRVLQAFGGSAVTVIATASVKDLYAGREREKIMAMVMSMVAIAPMVAPMIGALLLRITSWQMAFVSLACFGCISGLVSLFYQESLEKKFNGSLLHSLGRLMVVIKNPGFVSLLGIFSITSVAFMAYLAATSYVYVTYFGLSEQMFSFFFAFNVLFATTGPMLYIRVSKRYSASTVVTACFFMLTCCGLALGTFGHLSPWVFALAVAPATLATITMRVPAINLMLDQQEHDAGSVAALINFAGMLLGTIGMFLVSLNPSHMIESLGAIQFIVGLIGGGLWLLVRNRPFVLENVHEN
ncbi:MAG: multidrug effflux MFS transporter [Desulfuromusa sp.]|nr:multidrug effflux MFS transporter [Desulfuromusa sp.]